MCSYQDMAALEFYDIYTLVNRNMSRHSLHGWPAITTIEQLIRLKTWFM